MSDQLGLLPQAKRRAKPETFRAFSVMLEPKHLHKIEAVSRRHDMSKAEATRELTAAGLPLARAVQPPEHMAYENLDQPKRVHMRFPLMLYQALRARQTELGVRLGELVRMCLESGHIAESGCRHAAAACASTLPTAVLGERPNS